MPVPLQRPQVRRRRLFLRFFQMGLSAFGGGLNAHLLGLVRREGWFSDQEFAEHSTFAQTLPGSNNGNLSALLGYRLAGVPGALAALAGLLLPGTSLMLAASALYFSGALRFSPLADQALSGAAAAALGISVAAGLNILRFGFRTLAGSLTALLTAGLTLLLHQGTLIALLTLLPLGLLAQRLGDRRAGPGRR